MLERWAAKHSPPWEVLTLGFEPIPGARNGTWRVTAHALSDIPALTRAGEWYFFLRSLTITPEVDWTLADSPCALCSVNGLIGLQHPEPVQRRVSTLGIVWKVVDHETGDVVVHDAYLAAYNALKRQVKRLLGDKPSHL